MTARDRHHPAPTPPSPSLSPSPSPSPSSPASGRPQLIADAAIRLLAERGMRGLTHRAVDEAAGLPLGSTSNLARTREALLETAVRRLAEREAAVLTPTEMPTVAAHTAGPETATAGTPAVGTGPEALADAVALALHRYLSRHRQLLLARYELALEATRRPALREIYDRAGRAFREPMVAMLAAAGSTAPERHALSMVAWCDGVLFSCTAGQFHTATPTRAELRTSCAELLTGMLHRQNDVGR
ncbi:MULTISPECIES: TetR/AcrR family transcriptional regulator [Streptomyces]|uniref:TetR family transcriptional regulator n=1 Tax=Streptomyces siderophoricus TaxID=2802281 RepID=A0ABS1MPK1_9ACTN|nr:TetR/AcrR family transcriptional regulator [Streptomyces sp. 9-7]MBL1089698.1 TetR family transcriptional regulator [Streptomyces sp. 9-7]